MFQQSYCDETNFVEKNVWLDLWVVVRLQNPGVTVFWRSLLKNVKTDVRMIHQFNSYNSDETKPEMKILIGYETRA